MTSLSEASELTILKGLMKELGVSPQKSLGQNFLINENVIHKIVDHFDIKDQKVIEIGPGLGALTRRIIKKTDKLTLIELDNKLIEFWRDRGLEVLHQDALKTEWSSLSEDQNILLSNLPYEISASLVIDLSIEVHPIEKMVLMFQKEVAQRIQSATDCKSYGLISVLAQNVWDIKKVADLSLRDFHPSPKISSRVLAFEKKEIDPLIDKKFLSFVKHCFLNRRKLLLNKVVSYGKSKGMSKEEVVSVISQLNIAEKARAENVSPQIFLQLYKNLKASAEHS